MWSTDPTFGYLFISIKEGVRLCDVTYERYNLGAVLAVVGALWTSLFGILLMCSKNYQMFTYDKSLLKRLFFEDTSPLDGDDGQDGPDGPPTEKARFVKRLQSRK